MTSSRGGKGSPLAQCARTERAKGSMVDEACRRSLKEGRRTQEIGFVGRALYYRMHSRISNSISCCCCCGCCFVGDDDDVIVVVVAVVAGVVFLCRCLHH